ncbi:tumor protein D54-like isoform X2 [Pecten maximus]|uniref:tumor protein D54-like isoform X2 n=1 Tax=Pecten maximus TaxID=6579 RepID=UPI0014581A93|nr:tumor protein D54-like isoform X2 [Pecten maximus]
MTENNRKKSTGSVTNDKTVEGSDNCSIDDLRYEANISEAENYLKFLQLTHHEGSQSDEDVYVDNNGDLDGYIEDDIIGEMPPAEEDIDSDYDFGLSDLTEADEHMMYDNLESPTFETVEGVDGASSEEPPVYQDPAERERDLEKYREELAKVEGEITTLRQVLGSKVRYASELKRKMGITPFQELKQDIHYGFKTIKESDTVVKTNEKLGNVRDRITATNAYQKTNEKLVEMNDKITHSQAYHRTNVYLGEMNDKISSSSAYQKTSSAVKTASEKTNAVVSSFGASVSKKLGDIRNSNTFKSMEEKVGGAYSNVKAKVTGSKSEGSFEDALQSEKAKEEGANGTTVPEAMSLPEEKIPL